MYYYEYEELCKTQPTSSTKAFTKMLGLTPTHVAGVAGALCCDSNRPTSCAYAPSEALVEPHHVAQS
mgnify:CR=1 FL=1